MPNFNPTDVLLILAVLIWIDGLWLCKLILCKAKSKGKGATTVKGKVPKVGQVTDLTDLNYSDPWKRR